MVNDPPAFRGDESEGGENNRFSMTPTGGEFIEPLTYIIEPQIPDRYKDWFQHFKMMLSNTLPNANIRREDIPRYLDYFDNLWLWLKVRGVPMPGEARTSFRITMELQLTRAVEAFERRIQKTGIRERKGEVPEEEEEGGMWLF